MPLFCVLHVRPPLLGSESLPGHLVIGTKTFQMIAIVYFQTLKYLTKQGHRLKTQAAVWYGSLYLNLSVLAEGLSHWLSIY